MPTYFNPPKACDLCQSRIVDGFSDALIPRYAKWGNVCSSCAKSNAVRYGTGLGQRYELRPDGKFHKVEG